LGFQGVSLVAVEFYKTGVKIWTQYITDTGKLRLALQGEGPCNMIAQTPSLVSKTIANNVSGIFLTAFYECPIPELILYEVISELPVLFPALACANTESSY
jgi:hypothetical protein